MLPYYQDLFFPSTRKISSPKVPVFILSYLITESNQISYCTKSSQRICQTLKQVATSDFQPKTLQVTIHVLVSTGLFWSAPPGLLAVWNAARGQC